MNPEADLKNLEITFTAASGEPYQRYDEEKDEVYQERLIVTDEAVNLERLNGGASILKNHDPDKILGKILRAWCADGKLFVRAKFRKNDPESVQIFKDIVDGTMKNVSVGYFPTVFVPVTENGIVYRDVTQWTPFEVSVAVGVPADPTVGFYRSIKFKGKKMNEDEVKTPEVDTELEGKKDGAVPPEEEKTEEAKKEATPEEIRAAAVAVLRAAFPNQRSFNIPAPKSANTGRYSLARAFQSLLDPAVGKYEREVSDKLMRAAGLTPSPRSGIMLSFRDGNFTGADGSGKGLIGTDHRGDLFVRGLLPRMGVKGATVISGLTGNVDIPVQTGASAIGSGAVGSTSAATAPTVGSVTLSPKKFSASVTIGEDLLAQGNPDAIAFVIDDLSAQLARKIDLAILNGDTATGIKGVAGTTGVQSVTIADLTSATWKDILAMYGKVADYEIADGDLAWVMKGVTKTNFMGISKDAGSGRFICEEDKINGFSANVCGGLTADDLYLGVWKNIVVGQWGGLQIRVDDISGIKDGSVTIVAKLLTDIAVTNPLSFVKRAE